MWGWRWRREGYLIARRGVLALIFGVMRVLQDYKRVHENQSSKTDMKEEDGQNAEDTFCCII